MQRERAKAAQTQAVEQALQVRIRTLVIRYQAFAHYEDDAFLVDHAKTHTAQLLARRDEILAAYQELHSDPVFLARMQAQDSHTYIRATFEARALAQAERIAAQPLQAQPPKRRSTVEEVRARIVARIETKAEDKIARMRKKVEKLFQAARMLDEYPDLDSNDRLRLESEFAESIFSDEEETPHGNTRKETL